MNVIFIIIVGDALNGNRNQLGNPIAMVPRNVSAQLRHIWATRSVTSLGL